MKVAVIFVTDLTHSAPRISNFISHLKNSDDFEVILLGPSYLDILGDDDLPLDFSLNLTQVLFPRLKISKFLLSLTSRFNNKNKKDSFNREFSDLKSTSFIDFYISFRKKIILLYLSFMFPDQYGYYIVKYYKEFKKLNISKYENVILVSSSPYVSSHVACSLIKRFNNDSNIHWIADYRDLWSQNHNYPFSKLRNKLDSFLEKKILLKSDLVITVSSSWRDKLEKFISKKTILVPNGYSLPSNLSCNFSNLKKDSNKFYMLYVGSIYFGKQDVEFFINSICSLNRSILEKFELHFCGKFSSQLQRLVDLKNLDFCIKQIGVYSRDASISMQSEYDYLLYFDWVDDSGVLPLKFYEYIFANKPIIAVGHNSESNSAIILKELKRGYYLDSSINISSFISNNDYFKFNKELSFSPIENNKYSYEYRSKEFHEVLIKFLKNEL